MKLNFETLTAKGNLINSLLSQEEKAGNSALKYAVNKWNNKAQQATKPFFDDAQKRFTDFNTQVLEEIKDAEEFIFINFSEKNEKGVCLKDDKGEYVLTADNLKLCKAEINEKITPLKESITAKNVEINKELLATEIEFEPYLFIDQKKIATFDLFTAEELLGIFIPKETVLALPEQP